MDKLRRVIDTFEEARGKLRIRWAMESTYLDNVSRVCPDIVEELENILQDYEARDMGNIEYIDNLYEARNIVDNATAYYGSPGLLMNLSVQRKIPVMVWSINI